MIKDFAPLKLTLSLKGGYTMDYRIAKKESFTVLAVPKEFGYKNAKQEIPLFWEERFEYLIADIYNPSADKYPVGTNDKNYYAEIWIPIKKIADCQIG